MAGVVISWVLLTLCLASSFADDDGGLDVTLKVEPGKFEEGLTASLTVNCSVWYGDNSTYTNSTIQQPFAMIIYLNDTKEIATVSSVKAPKAPMLSDGGDFNHTAKVEGQLTTDGSDSYLAVTFEYPSAILSGSYKCELSGMDDGFHVTKLVKNATATVQSIDLPDAVDEIKSHGKRLDMLEMQMGSMFSRLDSFKNALSSFDFEINQTDYMVSRPIMQNAALAESACQLLGGYLLEINSEEEYNIVKDYLTNETVSHDILVGLNDEDVTGQWEFREHPMETPYWTTAGKPGNNADGHCGLLMHDQEWVLHAQLCYKNDINMQFVCEIPKP